MRARYFRPGEVARAIDHKPLMIHSGAVLGFERLGVPGALAIVRARKKAEKTLRVNGADGISDTEHVAIGNRAGRRERS